MIKLSELTEDEELELFAGLHSIAVEHRTFAIPIHSLDMPREDRGLLSQKWKKLGWIYSATSRLSGKWILAEEYRAYLPFVANKMTNEEKAQYINAARNSIGKDGSVKVLVFETMAPRIGFMRLLDAGIIVQHRREHCSRYILGDKYLV